MIFSGRLKKEIYKEVKSELTKADVDVIFNLIIKEFVNMLIEGFVFQIKNFGTFKTVKQLPKLRKNVSSGKTTITKGKNRLVFNLDKSINDSILKGKNGKTED